MGRVTVIFEVPPEDSDPSDGTGLTESAWNRLMAATSRLGWEINDTLGEVGR